MTRETRLILLCAVALVLSSFAHAQVVFYHTDSNPATGAANTIPWGQTAGYTTLHVYTADELQAAGVAPGAVLTDFAVAPNTAGSNTYTAPTARMLVGHLLNDTPIPTQWAANLDTPTIVHDTTSGPYSFPWAANTWTSLPGFAAAGFTWDGLRDIGIFYTSSSATGTFQSRQPGVNPRFGVTTFNATNQTPTTTGFFALKARLTFNGVPPQSNTAQASLTLNGSGAATHLYGGDLLTLQVTSSTATFQPFFLLLSPSFTGGHIPLSAQSFDLGAAASFYADILVATPGGFNPFLTGPILPFAGLDGAGNFTLPLPLTCGTVIAKSYLQAAIVDPSHPDGIRITGLPSIDVKPACRFLSGTAFPIAIPDGSGSASATVSVPPGTLITDLDAVIQITHASFGDLAMTLDLNGTTVVSLMIAGPADASDLTGRYQFSDEGLISLDTGATTSGTTIIPGRYAPDSPLSAFDNLDAGGLWTLTISDGVAANVGSLQGFHILVNGAE